MKNFILSALLILIVMSCKSGDKGELVGVKGKKYFPEKPFGMALVPGGSFIMGKSDDDLPGVQDAPTKTVTVRSFYMDETEITNSEYRQFVHWVRDSIIRYELAETIFKNEVPETELEAIRQYAYLGTEEGGEEPTADAEWDPVVEAAKGNKRLDWKADLIFDENDYPSKIYRDIIEKMRISKDSSFNNVAGWKVEDFKYKSNISDIDGYLKQLKLGGHIYSVDGEDNKKKAQQYLIEYEDYDNDKAYESVNSPSPNDEISMSNGEVYNIINEKIIKDFMDSDPDIAYVLTNGTAEEKNEVLSAVDTITYKKRLSNNINKMEFIDSKPLEVYPDTTVWITDFKYSYNEPMHNDYFSHDAYSDYPVVGITWDQASAFCAWRTDYKNGNQISRNKSLVPKFRLPTEAEWEFAARGGLQGATFPWGGPYTKNDRGCFLANFKPMRGDYAADAALYTVEGDAYPANDYGLFNMSGNVAEWVDSSYEADAYDYSSTMNPNVNNKINKKKITRGGSWKDVKYYLQVSSRNYEYEDVPRSFIGFRTVHDYLGTDLTANAQTNSGRIKR